VRTGSLAAGPGRGGQLGHPLLVALLAGGGLGLQQGLGALQPGQPLSPAGQRPRQLLAAGGAVLAVLGPVGRGGLGEQLSDLRLQMGMGAIGRRGGVGLDLGAIQGDQPQADQAGRRAQPQRGHQQPGQGLLVADPEPRDGHMIGGGVVGQHPKGDVLGQAPLDLAGGTDPGAIGIQQHPSSIRGSYAARPCPVGAIGLEERAQVQLVDHVQDEPGQVAGWQPVAQVGREQERLVTVAGKEVVGHGRSYATSSLCFLFSFPRPAPSMPATSAVGNRRRSALRQPLPGQRLGRRQDAQRIRQVANNGCSGNRCSAASKGANCSTARGRGATCDQRARASRPVRCQSGPWWAAHCSSAHPPSIQTCVRLGLTT
jgi:hypothetical protein